jgi:hypothetical protein
MHNVTQILPSTVALQTQNTLSRLSQPGHPFPSPSSPFSTKSTLPSLPPSVCLLVSHITFPFFSPNCSIRSLLSFPDLPFLPYLPYVDARPALRTVYPLLNGSKSRRCTSHARCRCRCRWVLYVCVWWREDHLLMGGHFSNRVVRKWIGIIVRGGNRPGGRERGREVKTDGLEILSLKYRVLPSRHVLRHLLRDFMHR